MSRMWKIRDLIKCVAVVGVTFCVAASIGCEVKPTNVTDNADQQAIDDYKAQLAEEQAANEGGGGEEMPPPQ